MKTMKLMAIALAALMISAAGADAARKKDNIGILRGVVLDSSDKQPVGWATVAIMKSDSTLVNGIACNDKGEYELIVAPGQYMLSATMLGYENYNESINVIAGFNAMDPIYLKQDTQMLAAASVTGRVSLVEMKMDKVVMNISQSAFAQGSNALDLIKKAPGVTVDKDGNVTLNGKAVSVWIDGRPSYLDGKSLEALLRSTNSESIEKFELMEHPSSKYDAAGQGGIINIKTKRNMLAGLNGSMGLLGGGMYFKDIDDAPWQQSYWLNLSYRTKKTNTFFSIYEGFYNTDMDFDNKIMVPFSATDKFDREAKSLIRNFFHNYNLKLGHDWFVDSKNTLGVIFFMPGEYGKFYTLNSASEQCLNGVKVQNTNSNISNISNTIQYTANLNYTHIFDETRSAEMTTNLDYYRNCSEEDNNQVDTVVFAATPDVKNLSYKYIDASRIYDIYSAKTDYQTVIFQKYMLEAGAKWALSMTDNSSIEQQTGLANINADFKYREHVGAVYTSFAGQFGPKFSLKAGLRAEYTNSFGDWISSGEQTSRSYLDVFPTMFAGFMPNENWRLSASYTRRINRPSYSQLNPTKTYVDANTYIVGNPDALPEYSNDFGLSAGYGQHLSFAVGYNHRKNAFSQLPSFGADGTEYLTWGNFGTNDLAYTSLSVAALPIGKYLQWTTSLTGLYMNSADGNGFVNSSFGGQAYMDFSFVLPKDWRVDLDGMYSTALTAAAFKVMPQFYTDLAIKKNLLEDKMTLSLTVKDLFRTMKNDIVVLDTTGIGTECTIGQKYYQQKVLVELTWNFGKAQQTRKRNVGNLDEMSRVGGSSLGN